MTQDFFPYPMVTMKTEDLGDKYTLGITTGQDIDGYGANMQDKLSIIKTRWWVKKKNTWTNNHTDTQEERKYMCVYDRSNATK